MKPLHTVEEVAEHFGLSTKQVIAKCSAATKPWPHHRPVSRRASTWRFSDEDIETIERLISIRQVTADPWGRTKAKAS